MAEKKGWGGTVLGWFVEFDDDKAAGAAAKGAAAKPAGGGAPPAAPASDATDDIIRRYADGGARKPAGKPPAGAGAPDTAPARSPSGEPPPDFGGAPAPARGAGIEAPAPGPGGAIDFQEVFRTAGITAEEADRVTRALTLLAQLPAETPQAVKKQIVEASLSSFGVPIESIIESAVAEIEALHGCIQAGQNATEALLRESEKRIAVLRRQITDVEEVMAARKAEQRSLEQQARAHGLKVQQILEFFGQDLVGKVVKESPRLHEPGGGSGPAQ